MKQLKIIVPFGTKKKIHVLIDIPESYVDGSYPIEVSFITVPSGEGGPVQIGTGITKSFGVLVGSSVIPEEEVPEEIQETSTSGLSSIVGILLMLAIFVVIIIIVRFIHKKK